MLIVKGIAYVLGVHLIDQTQYSGKIKNWPASYGDVRKRRRGGGLPCFFVFHYKQRKCPGSLAKTPWKMPFLKARKVGGHED